MLYDLDLTIEKLLTMELPQRFGDTVGPRTVITFCIPDRQVISLKSGLPALNLFLYDVRENHELRNNSWTMTRNDNGTATRDPSPVRVDCSYLITMWPSEEHNFQTEHEILSDVMKVLLRYSKLPPEILQGSLKNLQPPSRASVLGQTKLQSLGEFWQAMGGKPKVTLNYTLTISVPVQESQTVPLVAVMQLGEERREGESDE